MNKKKFKLISLSKKQKADFLYKKKVIIKDLLLSIIIGYYSSEKVKKQKVKFNILFINFFKVMVAKGNI